jgi:hypothetical protein
VHIRLATTQKLRQGAIKMTGRLPDGSEFSIVLRPDPASSTPGNPFEQSFAGEFHTGARAGTITLKAVVPVIGGTRVVEQLVAVVAN